MIMWSQHKCVSYWATPLKQRMEEMTPLYTFITNSSCSPHFMYEVYFDFCKFTSIRLFTANDVHMVISIGIIWLQRK
jgi:hypothetical protein